MWRELQRSDASAVTALRARVFEHLGHPDEYVREEREPEFVRGHLGEFGHSFGYELDGSLVAYCALTTDLVHSGADVEYEAAVPQPGDVVMAATMVHPQCRGRGLHRDAIRLRLDEATRAGASRALVQVSPYNIASLRGLFAEQFRCLTAVTYPDARRRLILARSVDAPSNDVVLHDVSLVELLDFGRIEQELRGAREGHELIRSASGAMLVVGA